MPVNVAVLYLLVGITVSGKHCILHRNGETCQKFWINWQKWDLNCLLSTHPHLATKAGTPPSPPRAAGEASRKPLCGKLLLVSEGFRQGLIFQTQEHLSPPVHWGWLLSFSLPDSKAIPAQKLWGRWWHNGEQGNEPCVQGGTYVLCRVVTEPQFFRLPDKLQGRNATGEETLHRNSSFPSARHPCTPEPQDLSLFLSSCPPQHLLSPGPEVTDASSIPLKPQLVRW